MATERAALQALTAVDGSLLPGPCRRWPGRCGEDARASGREDARGLRGAATESRGGRHGDRAGNASERAEWRRLVQPGGLYVVDRGYADDELFQELHDLPCRFLARVQYNAASEVQAERPVAAAAQVAGVRRDCLIRRLGTAHHTRLLPQPFRVVLVAAGKTSRRMGRRTSWYW